MTLATSFSYGQSKDDAGVELGGASIEVVSSVSTRHTAAQAASALAAECQTATSGQLEEGGWAVTNTEQFCDYMRLADAMAIAAEQETDSKMRLLYVERYHWALNEAYELLELTENTAILDRMTTQLMRPILLIVLIALIL